MSADKYPSILSRQMKSIVYVSELSSLKTATHTITWVELARYMK